MGRGWGKLPFTSLDGERGGLYIRHSRCDVSGQPAPASVFASLDFLQSAATSPLQALPEASEQEHAISRARGLCPAFAEWKLAHRSSGGGCDDAALQAVMELGGFALRRPPSSRRGRLLLHVPVDTRLPRGLLSSLGAADASTGKPRDFFAWVAGVAKSAAASGRLQLFLLTHRGATFAVMADGRDRARPTMHVFDPLGCTLHATNQRAYAVTFVASRRSGLEFNQRPPAEQAADFFYRRFHHTLKVDQAVIDAITSALDKSPEAASAVLKAAVRRHSIVEVQEVLPAAPVARQPGDTAASQLAAQLALLTNPKMSVAAIYETLVAPQGGSAPATPKGGPRLVRFASSPPGALSRTQSLASSPARTASTPQPWGRARNPRAAGAAAAGPPPLRRSGQDANTASSSNPASAVDASRRLVTASSAVAVPPPGKKAAPAAPSARQRAPVQQTGSMTASPPPTAQPRRQCSGGSAVESMAASFCAMPRSHAISGHCLRSSSEALLFTDVDEREGAPRAPAVLPASPSSPRMVRRKGAVAADLQRAATVMGTDMAAEARAVGRKRRADSAANGSVKTEIPESFKCKRDTAKLQAAIAKSVGASAAVKTQQGSMPAPSAFGMQSSDVTPAAAAAAAPQSTNCTNTFARISDSSGDGSGGGGSSIRRPSGGAASDNSSALRSSNSDGSNTASGGKASPSSMSTDSAYGRAAPESLRSKFKGRTPAIGTVTIGGSGGKLSSIPEPDPPLPAKARGFFAEFKAILRWT